MRIRLRGWFLLLSILILLPFVVHANPTTDALIDACISGKYFRVKQRVEKGADVNAVDEFGKTPIMFAAENGHVEIVILLIKKGAYINEIDSEGNTALSLALSQSHTEIVKLLLEQDAEFSNKLIKCDQSIIVWAAKKGHTDIVDLLIKKGTLAKMPLETSEAFIWAASKDHIDIVYSLLQDGVYVDVVTNKAGTTALMAASGKGNVNIVKLLLKNNADIGLKTSKGSTALSLAKRRKSVAIINLLQKADKKTVDVSEQ